MKIDLAAFVHDSVAKSCGFDEYTLIMDRFQKVDVSRDKPFQRTFTHFYRVRRSQDWLCAFYGLFERLRYVPCLDFRRVLCDVAEMSDGRVEISFSSKLLATVRPEMPIWDKYVRIVLGLPEVPPAGTEGRLDAAVDAYAQLEERTNRLLSQDEVRREIERFDETFPDYARMSSMKKLDFLLWGAGKSGD